MVRWFRASDADKKKKSTRTRSWIENIKTDSEGNELNVDKIFHDSVCLWGIALNEDGCMSYKQRALIKDCYDKFYARKR